MPTKTKYLQTNPLNGLNCQRIIILTHSTIIFIYNLSQLYFVLPVDFLADLYIHGETTYEIEEKGKLKSVTVSQTQYTLTEDAIREFEGIHDSCEKDICEKNPHDALIGGD